MSHIQFSVNAVFPLILTALCGYFCKRIGLISQELAKGLNRLVFRLFLPAMLFLNVYNIQSISQIDLTYVWYTLGITLVLFLAAIPLTRLITKDPKQRGVLVQASFRSNFALVGIPLASSLFGTEGGIVATVLSAFLIPLFNILAVFSLSLFSNEKEKRPSPKKILLGILKNPLIISIALGGVVLLVRALFAKSGIAFRLTDVEPLYKMLSWLSSVATPLSLIVLGAQFEFSAVRSMRKQLTFGIITRGVVIPLLGLGGAYLLGCFEGAHFAAFVAAFATPIAVSSVPMAQEMGADSELAGQLVIWTTLTSALTMFVCATVLKAVGVF